MDTPQAPNWKTSAYFNSEVCHFYQLCGDRRSTVRELAAARRGLYYLYLHCTGDVDRLAATLQVADENYQRRLPFFNAQEIHAAD